MKKSNKFSPEVRERAVRMVQEQRGEYPSLWAAIESIAPKIGCVPQTLNEWVKIHLSLDMGYRLHHRRILKKAEPYLGLCVGGHAWQTVANSIHFSQNKLDGIIQVMPFGCMPEIVAESILPRVYEDYGVPIMTLVVDEMTGEAGYFTRLEAFIDLLEQRRNRTGEKKPSLSGG